MKRFIRLTDEQLTVKDAAQKQIREFKPGHDYLACFDMDGHLFDSMSAKQVIVFHPVFMDKFNLRTIESFYRLHAENHNLWTEDRGCDRHEAKSFTLGSLLEDPVLKGSISGQLRHKIKLLKASVDSYINFIKQQGLAYSYDSLFEFSRKSNDDNLAHLAEWSSTCDHEFAFVTIPIPPFKRVKETMDYLADKADVWVISKTPYNDICNWLEEHNLIQFVDAVAGKEMGGKDEHICMLKGGQFDAKQKTVIRHGIKYADGKVIMGGDGNGDLKAVKKNNGLFFGTPPGKEQEAWGKALDDVFRPFFTGQYAGEKENIVLDKFKKAIKPRGFWKNEDYKDIEDHIRYYEAFDETRVNLYEKCKKGGKLLAATKLKQSLK